MASNKQAFEALQYEKHLLTELSIALSEIGHSKDLVTLLAEQLQKITGSSLVVFLDYDHDQRNLIPLLIKAKHKTIQGEIQGHEREFLSSGLFVSDSTYKNLVSHGVGQSKTLHEISFGLIPEEFENKIQSARVFDRYYWMVFTISDKLYGAAFFGLKKSQPDPSFEVLHFFSWMAAISIRRKKDESEKILAEMKINRSDEKYSALFRNMTEGVFYQSSDGTLLDVNESALKLFGLTRDQFIGRTSYHPDWKVMDRDGQILPPEKHPSMIALNTGKTLIDFELSVFNPTEGKTTWMLVNATPQFLSNQVKADQVFVTLRNNTSHKLDEEALRESEEKYRKIFEGATEGIFQSTPRGTYLSMNPAFARMFGFDSPKEMIDIVKNSGFDLYANPGTRAEIGHLLAENGAISGFEAEVKRKDGTLFLVSVNAHTVPGKTGEVLYYEGTCNDITQRLHAEDGLRKAEERFRALIENAPDGIALVSHEGEFKYVSPAAKKIFFYDTDEPINRKPDDLTHPDDLPMVYENLSKLLADPSFVPVLQYRFHAKDGSWRWIESTFTNMLSEPSVEAIVINFRDINDRKIAEEEIGLLNISLEKRVEERTSELTAANKELEAFAYTVSHDLRAPVRAIGGFTRILEEDYLSQLNEEGQRVFRVILDNTSKMEHLIDDLLSFSRLSRADMNLSTVNMAEIIWKCFNEITSEDERRRIRMTMSDLPLIKGDYPMLVQVWTNLLSNAIKYTSQCESPEIQVECNRLKEEYVFSIKDNGSGFDMKYADKLFAVFQRLHSEKEYAGTGVGLAIVQRVIQRHGGRIWAEATLNQGAQFFFTLKP